MKITKQQLRRIIREEKQNILKEMFPPRAGERYDPITMSILRDIINYADAKSGESMSFDGSHVAEVLRVAADIAEGN